MPPQLVPLAILLVTSFLIVAVRRGRTALAGRRERRAAAEAAEYARIIGWIKVIRPENTGPAITRGKDGRVEVFRGLRRYAGGRRTRRGRKV